MPATLQRLLLPEAPGAQRQGQTDFQGLLQTWSLCAYLKLPKLAARDVTCPSCSFYIVIDADKRPPDEHERCYNVPACNEVAAIIHGEQDRTRDIVLKSRDDALRRISDTDRSYDALQYPLLFPYEDGYHFGIPLHTPGGQPTKSSKGLSRKAFYSYRFMKQLPSDSYIHLRDSLRNEVNPRDLEKLCILHSIYTGGRYIHERTQNAMTYVKQYGRPDLFITFTCNPKWVEITRELLPGQDYTHKHDITARVVGPSFEAIRTVDGVARNTYREACLKCGFLEDDFQWDAGMAEGALLQAPATLRCLFAILILDIRDSTAFMGGFTLLLSGDFRQTLLVIPKGTWADAVRECLKSFKLWAHVQSLQLTTNMRAHTTGDKLVR
ncbi:unnamed protein product [Acanthosepion pharaonis]|uniref:ATP-dependent DNA helicase n=1 Tax=Acanthosepion pharaonis TaxID=158019 RepID=A0A812BAB0_ACAPH|nr:unnamed protein product [Sepia pharaonis]